MRSKLMVVIVVDAECERTLTICPFVSETLTYFADPIEVVTNLDPEFLNQSFLSTKIVSIMLN